MSIGRKLYTRRNRLSFTFIKRKHPSAADATGKVNLMNRNEANERNQITISNMLRAMLNERHIPKVEGF